MEHSRRNVPSPQASDSDAPATSPEFYVNVDGKAYRDLADLNGAEEPMYHAVLKTNFMEQQEVCRCANGAVLSSMLK